MTIPQNGRRMPMELCFKVYEKVGIIMGLIVILITI